jgi:hypothetical protein
MRPRRTAHSEQVIIATASLLYRRRIAAGMTQKEAATQAAALIERKKGSFDAMTWLRAEKSREYHGRAPGGGAAVSLVDVPPGTLAAMALAVRIEPDEMREIGRPDAAELMDEILLTQRSGGPARPKGVHPALVEINDRLHRLDDARVAAAGPVLDGCLTFLDRLADEQRLIPQQRLRAS